MKFYLTLIKKIIKKYYTGLGDDNRWLAGFFIFLISPLIILSFFNNPGGDDYWLGSFIKESGLFGGGLEWYNNVSGRYFRIFLAAIFETTALKYGIYHWWFKFFPTFLIIIFFIFSINYLLKSIFEENRNLFLMSFIILAFYLLKSPGFFNVLYDVNGMTIYASSYILLITLGAILLNTFRAGYEKVSIKKLLLISTLIFCIIGTNEASAVNLILLLILLGFLMRIKKVKIYFVLMTLISIVLLISVVINAPGNSKFIRTSGIAPDDSLFLLKSIYFGIFDLPYIFFNYSFDFSLILFSLLLLILIKTNSFSYNFKIPENENIIIFMFFWIFCFSMPMAGNYLGLKSFDLAPRTLGQMYFFFFVGWIFFLGIFSNLIKGKYLKIIIEYKSLILLLLFFSLTAKSNFIHVLFDLPQAYKHNLEVLDRYEFIVNQEQKRESIVYMEPYQYRPTIPLGGVPQMLNTNTKHPWNRPLANFFNVDSIKVSKDLHWLYGPHPYYGYSQHPYPVRILHHNLYRLHYFLVAPFKLIFG
tara:strand:- start:2471 stop:4060 length:1590 start_codon:yes stop_codon:yes gene_type:complete